MKKSLLFLVSVLMSAASFAQSLTATWEKPEAPEFISYAPETTFYLWNVGGKGFFINHQGGTAAPYYGTHASINADKGTEVIFTRTNPGSTEETDLEATTAWEENTYLLVSYVTKFSEMRCAFYTNADDVWTDNNGQENRYWTVVPNGNYIKITGSKLNAVEKNETYSSEGYYLSVEEDDPEIVRFNDPSSSNYIDGATYFTDWACVTPEAYKEFNRYMVAEELKEAIEALQEFSEGAVDLSAPIAVYNNTNSKYADLEEAIEQVNAKKAEYLASIASEDNPADFTDLLVNPDFSAGNISGWTCTYVKGENATNIGYQGANYKNGEVTINQFIEAWAAANTDFNNKGFRAIGVGELSQTIKNMPQGKYSFSVDCIANQQDGKASPVSGVELFATGGDVDIFQTISTGNGAPEHFEITFVNNGSEIKMGLRTTEECTANWIAADNFTLKYFGPTAEDPFKVLLDATIADALKAHPLEELDDVVATASLKDAFKKTIEEAQAATADYQEQEAKVKAAQTALEEAIAAYKTFAAKADKGGEWETKYGAHQSELDDYDYEDGDEIDQEWYDFGDFMGGETVEGYPTPSIEDVLTDMEQTPAEIEAYIAKVEELYAAAYAKSLRAGMDCTGLLVNASFADGFNGWTNFCGVTGGLETQPIVECYQDHGKYVDCYQIVNNVPDGVYTLTCQAFERPAGNGSYNGTEESKVFLYMNNYQTPVMNICADAMPEDKAEDEVNCYLGSQTGAWPYDYDVAGYGWVPNSVDGGSYAFLADSEVFPGQKRYINTAHGYIEGGTMKIGLTSNGVQHHWVLWANFKLTYEGFTAEATKIMLDAEIEKLQTYLDNNSEENITSAAAEATQDVIDAAEKVAENGDSDQMLAEIEKVKAGLAAAQENAATLVEFKAASEALYAAMEDTDHSAAGEDAFNEIADDVDEGYDTMSTEDLKALIAKMKEVTMLLNTPDYSNASDENPVEFTKRIVNNSFETGTLDGWTTKAGNDTNVYPNTNDTYTIDLIDGDYLFNTWSNSAVEGGLSLSQNIGTLPAGTYKLTAVIASFPGHIVKFGVNDEDMDIVIEKAKTEATEVEFIFKLEEEGEVTIKTSTVTSGEEAENKTETFFKADNYRLFYYGANSEMELTPTAIDGIEAGTAKKANGKYLENGRIVIIKNGVKYNVAGQMIK